MREKSLTEQADDLLRALCSRERKSMRQLGMIDRRRLRTIREHEIPMGYMTCNSDAILASGWTDEAKGEAD